MFIAALSSELSEKMAIGGKLTLMGILIVFGLLALIVVVLTIMERIMRKSGEKPKKERKNLKELFKNKMQKNPLLQPIFKFIIKLFEQLILIF